MDLIGHRGARGEAPENTLAGFRHLRALGLRQVEFDIRVAADGELVVIHDASVERTCSPAQGRVDQLDCAQLAALDACHHRNYPLTADGTLQPWPEREGVPTLAAVLAELHDFTHLQLEVKADDERITTHVAAQLPTLWQPFGPRAITTSFNPHYLQLARQHCPQMPRGLLAELDYAGDLVADAVTLGCVSIGPHQALCSPELVTRAHAAGLRVSVWTVNSVERALELRAMGVDSVISDVPQVLLAGLPCP